MKITRLENAAAPVITDSGEKLFELIGNAEHLGSSKQLSLARSIISPGTHSAAHFHKSSTEILYILEGLGRLEVDGKSVEVKPGDVCLLESGEVHSLYNLAQNFDLELLAITGPAWTPTDAFSVASDDNN